MCLGKDKKLLDTSRNWIIYPYIASGPPKESDIFFRGGGSISKIGSPFFWLFVGGWLSLGARLAPGADATLYPLS